MPAVLQVKHVCVQGGKENQRQGKRREKLSFIESDTLRTMID
jgi:hypothetical protein